MSRFLDLWTEAARTSAGFFWSALWAFGLGYLISSLIQVFVTRRRMREQMGDSGPKSVGLGAIFGFVSSSCSFAALSTTRALLAKGAGLIPSLAFLLASTNLVIELGIVISLFLGWQFVVGEYAGGVLLIGLMWIAVKLTLPRGLESEARDRAREAGGGDDDSDERPLRQRLADPDSWRAVAETYVGEWQMVWKDVTVGFTVAGLISAFVPRSFFESLFVGSGDPGAGFGEVLLQSIVGPVAAFFTFIGSMGNIPLAAVLFDNGVAFAGVMAFIFSDLVVFPVLRIQARYYGIKAALYILGVLFAVLVAASVIVHYGFAAAGQLPDPGSLEPIGDRQFFAVDYTLFLNVAFIALSAAAVIWALARRERGSGGGGSWVDRTLLVAALLSFAWLGGGLLAGALG